MLRAKRYQLGHGDTLVMVVMAPFRDELSHEQFRELSQKPRVKSRVGGSADRAHVARARNRRVSLSLSLSPSLSVRAALPSGSWNMQRTIIVIYHFQAQIPWLSFPLVPLTDPRTSSAFSLFSTIFLPSLSPRYSERTARELCSQPA